MKTPCTMKVFLRNPLSAALMLAMATAAHAGLPVGGVVAGGQANITQSGNHETITQSTANVVINWQSFSIGSGQTVQFVQPGSSSVALNRVLGSDPSLIFGSLLANGKVFLLNPNGVLFGSGASVNVGGLVASTMSMTDSNFMAGKYVFTGAGSGAVVNQGSIAAGDGGYVALMGREVSNTGVISARLGSVILAGGKDVTLDLAGDGLLNVAVTQGAVNALVENSGAIRADGGRVLLTAQAAGNILDTVVNNTGVIQAQTIGNRNGSIMLLGDMQSGTVNLISGVLDASAPNGGDGGSVTTSAAHVNVRDTAKISTAAPYGSIGTWLIDPHNFTIGSAPGDNISGATLSAELVTNNINISTAGSGTQPGDITVNDAVS
ncbi:MAG TPA: filamentous hemagglutinin N-terminal domain-containing protein, partial [Xanthomonadaceae bacterium]|nr:filamentous hemagglutinin N-terminal domain-containing protein [Xanthomonadaceae bacterium]